MSFTKEQGDRLLTAIGDMNRNLVSVLNRGESGANASGRSAVPPELRGSSPFRSRTAEDRPDDVTPRGLGSADIKTLTTNVDKLTTQTFMLRDEMTKNTANLKLVTDALSSLQKSNENIAGKSATAPSGAADTTNVRLLAAIEKLSQSFSSSHTPSALSASPGIASPNDTLLGHGQMLLVQSNTQLVNSLNRMGTNFDVFSKGLLNLDKSNQALKDSIDDNTKNGGSGSGTGAGGSGERPGKPPDHPQLLRAVTLLESFVAAYKTSRSGNPYGINQDQQVPILSSIRRGLSGGSNGSSNTGGTQAANAEGPISNLEKGVPVIGAVAGIIDRLLGIGKSIDNLYNTMAGPQRALPDLTASFQGQFDRSGEANTFGRRLGYGHNAYDAYREIRDSATKTGLTSEQVVQYGTQMQEERMMFGNKDNINQQVREGLQNQTGMARAYGLNVGTVATQQNQQSNMGIDPNKLSSTIALSIEKSNAGAASGQMMQDLQRMLLTMQQTSITGAARNQDQLLGFTTAAYQTNDAAKVQGIMQADSQLSGQANQFGTQMNQLGIARGLSGGQDFSTAYRGSFQQNQGDILNNLKLIYPNIENSPQSRDFASMQFGIAPEQLDAYIQTAATQKTFTPEQKNQFSSFQKQFVGGDKPGSGSRLVTEAFANTDIGKKDVYDFINRREGPTSTYLKDKGITDSNIQNAGEVLSQYNKDKGGTVNVNEGNKSDPEKMQDALSSFQSEEEKIGQNFIAAQTHLIDLETSTLDNVEKAFSAVAETFRNSKDAQGVVQAIKDAFSNISPEFSKAIDGLEGFAKGWEKGIGDFIGGVKDFVTAVNNFLGKPSGDTAVAAFDAAYGTQSVGGDAQPGDINNGSATPQWYAANGGPRDATGKLISEGGDPNRVIPASVPGYVDPNRDVSRGYGNTADDKYVPGITSPDAVKKIDPARGYATGTSNAPPGMAWVGENGPELERMNGGEQVATHGSSQGISLVYATESSQKDMLSVLSRMLQLMETEHSSGNSAGPEGLGGSSGNTSASSSGGGVTFTPADGSAPIDVSGAPQDTRSTSAGSTSGSGQLNQFRNMSKDDYERIIKKGSTGQRQSDLLGSGQYESFIAGAQKGNIDPYFALATMQQETHFGSDPNSGRTATAANNNYIGMGHASSPISPYQRQGTSGGRATDGGPSAYASYDNVGNEVQDLARWARENHPEAFASGDIQALYKGYATDPRAAGQKQDIYNSISPGNNTGSTNGPLITPASSPNGMPANVPSPGQLGGYMKQAISQQGSSNHSNGFDKINSSQDWINYCQAFVESSLQNAGLIERTGPTTGKFASANQAKADAAARGALYQKDAKDVPAGAIVYADYGGDGHTGFSEGGGKYISGGLGSSISVRDEATDLGASSGGRVAFTAPPGYTYDQANNRIVPIDPQNPKTPPMGAQGTQSASTSQNPVQGTTGANTNTPDTRTPQQILQQRLDENKANQAKVFQDSRDVTKTWDERRAAEKKYLSYQEQINEDAKNLSGFQQGTTATDRQLSGHREDSLGLADKGAIDAIGTGGRVDPNNSSYDVISGRFGTLEEHKKYMAGQILGIQNDPTLTQEEKNKRIGGAKAIFEGDAKEAKDLQAVLSLGRGNPNAGEGGRDMGRNTAAPLEANTLPEKNPFAGEGGRDKERNTSSAFTSPIPDGITTPQALLDFLSGNDAYQRYKNITADNGSTPNQLLGQGQDLNTLPQKIVEAVSNGIQKGFSQNPVQVSLDNPNGTGGNTGQSGIAPTPHSSFYGTHAAAAASGGPYGNGTIDTGPAPTTPVGYNPASTGDTGSGDTYQTTRVGQAR